LAVWLTLIIATGIGGYLLGSSGNKPPQQSTAQPFAEQERYEAAPSKAVVQLAGLNENSIANIAAAAEPSVVSIDSSCNLTRKSAKYFFGENMGPSPPSVVRRGHYGSGAGLIYSSDGYILTAAHVVRVADEIIVHLADKRSFPAKLVGEDALSDLAVLKIESTDLPAMRFGDSDKVRAGDWAIAIGSPMKFFNSISFGIVSALNRNVGEPLFNVDMIQTDAAINPGSSGGPLLNMRGEVIGINSIIRWDAQNIGFAIPSNLARSIASELLKHGKVEHGFLGVRLRDQLPAHETDTDKMQVLVAGVVDGSPAKQGGLEINDVIKTVNNQQIHNSTEIRRMILRAKTGEYLQIGITRRGKAESLQLKAIGREQK
jgi:S1-C subfamily serine protease